MATQKEVDDLNKELGAAKAHIEELELAALESTDKSDALEASNKELTEQNQSLAGTVKESADAAAELQKQNDALSELNQKLGADAEAAAKDHETLTKQNDILQEAVDEMEEKLKAAQEGGDTKEGGKEARGEEMSDFLKPEYTGPVDVGMAEKIAAQRKKEADAEEEKGKDK